MTKDRSKDDVQGPAWQLRAEFSLPEGPGGEDLAMAFVTQVVHELILPSRHLEQPQVILKDAVHNAIQHSRSYRPGSSIVVRIFVSGTGLEDLIQDGIVSEEGGLAAGDSWPKTGKDVLSPIQGLGHFLIERTVDKADGPVLRAIELYLYAEGGGRGARPTEIPPLA